MKFVNINEMNVESPSANCVPTSGCLQEKDHKIINMNIFTRRLQGTLWPLWLIPFLYSKIFALSMITLKMTT